MQKNLKESDAAVTSSGNIAVVSGPITKEPIRRTQEISKTGKYANTPNLDVFGQKGDKSVSR